MTNDKGQESLFETRPVRKFGEHIQDALFHIQNSKVSMAVKMQVNSLLAKAAELVAEEAKS